MAKKEKSLEESKKKKEPFNVLRKGAIAGLLGLTIGFGCLGLAGCSLNGTDGKDGAQWYSGIETPTTQGVNGDFYLDTDDYILYQKVNGQWTPIMNEFGKPGEKGDKGDDGTGTYVGYDGYIWVGSQKTSAKISDVTDGNVVLNTIGLVNHNRYFDTQDIDLSTTQVALMDNYFENIAKVGYSSVTIEELSLYSTNGGKITIGTAKVSDILTNRKTGTVLTLNNTKTYTLIAGVTNLTELNISVGEDETLVLGNASTDTAKLISYEGINVDDEQGNFTSIVKDRALSSESDLDATDSVKDKLAIKMKIGTLSSSIYVERTLFDNLTNYTYAGTEHGLNNANGPFAFGDKTMFANSKLKSLSFKLISDDSSIITFPIYVVKQDIWTNSISRQEGNYTKYEITLPLSRSVGSTITLDLTSYNINVGADETLCFANSGLGNFKIAYHYGTSALDTKNSLYKLMLSNPTEYPTTAGNGVTINIKVVGEQLDSEGKSFAEHLEELQEENIKAQLKNKNISIFGDSISTCEGYTDNNNYNTTLSSNQSRYYATGNQGEATLQLDSVNETWWMQTINGLEGNLLVNNSWRGKKVTDSSSRATQLHDDTTGNNPNNEIINPDIIIIMLGTNDCQAGDSIYNIMTSYKAMIESIKSAYPNADIFVGSLLNYSTNSYIDTINQNYQAMCQEFGLGYIDFYNCGITSSNTSTYLFDSLHPNQAGFDLMSKVAIQSIIDYYKSQN